MNDYLDIKTIELEKLRFGLELYLSEDFLIDQISIGRVMLDQIRLQLRAFVWAETKSIQHQEVTFPADWWQHFKIRWFPDWAIRRWPPQYTTVVLDVKAVYPNFRPAMPKEQSRLTIQRYDGYPVEEWRAK